MKMPVLLLVVALFCFAQDSSAQMPGQNSSIAVARGRAYVEKFQVDFGCHPSSFIIKVDGSDGDGIGDYLADTYPTLENAYLHVYFGIKKGTGDGKDERLLVMTGAKLATNANTGKSYLTHDKKRSKIWATPVHEPDGAVPFDCDFDAKDRYVHKVCDISDCSTGVTDEEAAKEYIKYFQSRDCNVHDPQSQTESFLFCANDLRKFLKEYPEVKYLQFYAGYRPQARFDNVTLLIVGLDNVGHHIWDRDDEGFPYLFDKAVPCPRCSIEHDARIDYHHQAGSKLREMNP